MQIRTINHFLNSANFFQFNVNFHDKKEENDSCKKFQKSELVFAIELCRSY